MMAATLLVPFFGPACTQQETTPTDGSTTTTAPDIVVQSLTLSSDEIVLGDTVTVVVRLHNHGTAEGSHVVVLQLDGVEIERRDVSVGSATTKEVSFEVQYDTVGTYLLKVETASARLIVTEPPSQVDEVMEQPTDAARIAILSPDPIPVRRGEWSWRVTLIETNGFDVELKSIVMRTLGGDRVLNEWTDYSWLQAIDHFLPARESRHSNRFLPYREDATHVVFLVSGVDENGHSITAEKTVTLDHEQPKEGEAEIEIIFTRNPVTCGAGRWIWGCKFTEVNGIGITLEQFTMSWYRNGVQLETSVWGKDWITHKLPDCYLAPHRSISYQNNMNCQNLSYAIYTVTGIDDNGNEITATARLDFVR